MKVAAAMSGGVDSSTTAAILKEKGNEVYGITMKLSNFTRFSDKDSNDISEPSNIEDAQKVAEKLGFPHFTINLEEEFKEEVVDYFTSEYILGKTPNPCIRCNQRIKFKALFKFLDDHDIEYLATGHYARNVYDEEAGIYRLLRGKDRNKDQSYFLYTLTQKKLERILFPLGEYAKTEVRKMAGQFGLSVKDKTESNEVCFVPNDDYKGFLKNVVTGFKSRIGDFIDMTGKKLGKHKGIHAYTIGQRRGLGISSDRPYYVKEINPKDNTITLCRKEELQSKGFIVKELNFIAGSSVDLDCELQVQLRYRHDPIDCILLPFDDDGRAKVIFDLIDDAPTPGQAAVFYKGDEVIGGGWIE
ncbi:tRNA 2-thiouridine(34) synthase MnmA [bacterium]|nr:tRNA 2-thiouridine(34) synthase MnmA [bacterium]